MSTVTEFVDVNVPVRTAYNQWTQFEEFPRFMEGVSEIRQLDDTHTHWKTEIGGVKREFDAEITEQLPDERVAWHATDGENLAKLAAEAPTGTRLRYVCVIAHVDVDGTERTFEGTTDGRVADAPRGEGGFGYDPLFVPDEGHADGRTMAELSRLCHAALEQVTARSTV